MVLDHTKVVYTAEDGGDSHFVQVNLMEIKNAANNIPSNNNIINDTDNLQGN